MTLGAKSGETPIIWSPPRRAWGWADLLALCVWSAAVAIVFWHAVTLQQAFFYFDVTEINFPYRDWLARQYRSGLFARWHPGLYCGLPIFSESQAGFLHPLKVLYLFLSSWRAFNLDTVLSVWLTGVGAYGWLRRHMGVAGSLTGAAVIGLGGFTWAHLIHTSMINALISVPLAVWALEYCWDSGRLRGVALGALALACQVFAGHLQDVILTGLLLLLYAACRAGQASSWRERRYVLATALGMVALGGMLAAVQALPSRELIGRSPRAEGLSWDELTYGSWSPELLPSMLTRAAYGTRARDTDWMDGFYPYHEMDTYLSLLALGLAAVGARAYRDRWVGSWVLIAGIGLVMMLGRFTLLFDMMPRIPIIGSGRIPVRYHLWLTLAVGALAGVGVDRLARPGEVRLKGAAWFLIGLGAACVPILAYAYLPVWTDAARWVTPYHQARYNWLARELAGAVARTLGLAGLGFLLAARAGRTLNPTWRAWWAAALPVLLLTDLVATHWEDAPTIAPSYWTEPPPSAEWLRSQADLKRVFGLGMYASGEPGYSSKPVHFESARDTLAWAIAPVWGLSSSSGATPIISSRLVAYDEAAKAAGARFDIETVSHLLLGTTGRDPRFDPPVHVGAAYIFHNPNALPRARLLGRPIYAASAVEAERILRTLGSDDARERVIVEDPTRPLPDDTIVQGTAKIVHDAPERVEVEIEAEMPAYLFLADTYDPGWTATLDGLPAPIRPADLAFRAVYVPSGRHQIVFRYRPVDFDLGLAVSGMGVLIALGALACPRRRDYLTPAHGPSNWPCWWPIAGLLAFGLLVGGSVVSVSTEGHIHWHSRWETGFHRFTWGAKVEAIKPPPAPPRLSGERES